MTRMLGTAFIMLAGSLMLSSAAAQETKKSKLDVDAVFRKLDANGDEKLQKDEFLKLADHFKDKGKARDRLTSAFTTIDGQKRGFLSKDQLRTYFDEAKKRVEKQ